jgi:phosphohistidine phosphatase
MSRTLYLIRHAKSSWDEQDLDDIDRPLSKRGQRDVPVMGARLKDRGILPDLMISSPARRAHDTAQMLAGVLGYPQKEILVERQLYEATAGDILEVVKSIPDTAGTAMVFGHNPGLTEAIAWMTTGTIDNVPTCGIAEIEFGVDAWDAVEPRSGQLKSFDYPKRETRG